jgi:3-dehydroquinate synthetase
MNADNAKKAELYRQYQDRVAAAEANRDEALTAMGGDMATDAAIAEAERDYNRSVVDVGRD